MRGFKLIVLALLAVFATTPTRPLAQGGITPGPPAGGAGSGTVTTLTPPTTLNAPGIAITPTDGLIVTNATASTGGVQTQMSPRIRFHGGGWTGAADATADWTLDVLPVSAASATSFFRLNHSNAGTAYVTPLTLNTGGTMVLSGPASGTATYPQIAFRNHGDGSNFAMVGRESSSGTIITGSTTNDFFVRNQRDIIMSADGGSTIHLKITTGGAVQIAQGLTATGGVSGGAASFLSIATRGFWQAGADGVWELLTAAGSRGIVFDFNAVPTIGACGTSPSIAADATDSTGTVTVGSGGTLTSCIVTFNGTWAKAPKCFASVKGTSAADARAIATSASTTALTMTPSAAFTASNLVDYWCVAVK